MKYIKDYNKFDIKQLKRFIVTLDVQTYFIDELLGVGNSKKTIFLKNYATYGIDDYKFEEYKNKMKIEINVKYLDNLVYSSNTYEECYEYLQMAMKTDKYNI